MIYHFIVETIKYIKSFYYYLFYPDYYKVVINHSNAILKGLILDYVYNKISIRGKIIHEFIFDFKNKPFINDLETYLKIMYAVMSHNVNDVYIKVNFMYVDSSGDNYTIGKGFKLSKFDSECEVLFLNHYLRAFNNMVENRTDSSRVLNYIDVIITQIKYV